MPDIDRLIDDRPADGIFRIHRDIYRDSAVFEREIECLFEGGWVFVAHASQIPEAHGFIATQVGRSPVLVMRDGDGRLACFHNTCPHKGAQIVNRTAGRRRVHTCPYHGWSFASDGRLLAIKDHAAGAYAPSFDLLSHDLARVAAFADYRGFLFASLNADVPPLENWLGDARVFIDMVVDQSPDGMELVPGRVSYRFAGNWKLQLENSLDAYHLTSVHPSFFRLLDRRALAADRADATPAIWQTGTGGQVEEEMGAFTFESGHALVWTRTPVERHPLYAQRESLIARVGAVRADWMMRTRQFNLFPNLQLASNAALQMRVIRPVAVDVTEITSYCVAPRGEAPAARTRRIRQYEDFFNPSGMATPDDTVLFESSQRGFAARGVAWQQGAERGAALVVDGADRHASELGIVPVTSMHAPFTVADETVFRGMYRAWAARLAAEKAR